MFSRRLILKKMAMFSTLVPLSHFLNAEKKGVSLTAKIEDLQNDNVDPLEFLNELNFFKRIRFAHANQYFSVSKVGLKSTSRLEIKDGVFFKTTTWDSLEDVNSFLNSADSKNLAKLLDENGYRITFKIRENS